MPTSGNGRDRWLLLHGTPLTPSVWDEIAALVEQHGDVRYPNTAPTAGETEPQVAAAQRIIGEVIAPSPADTRWHVVGHSYGGQVALEVAFAAGSRVATLTILCSRDRPYPPFAVAADQLTSGGPTDVDAVLARWLPPSERTGHGPLVDYVRSCVTTVDPDVWATALRGIAVYDRQNDTSRLLMPTTLFAAGHDQVPTPVVMTAMASNIPHAVLHVDADAWHMTPFLHPRRTADFILDASRRHSSSTTAGG